MQLIMPLQQPMHTYHALHKTHQVSRRGEHGLLGTVALQAGSNGRGFLWLSVTHILQHLLLPASRVYGGY
jgi:hypothetical protein